MAKGYQLLLNNEIGKLLNYVNDDMIVILYYWVIHELYNVLGNELNGIELEVVRVVHHYSAYPGLAAHYLEPMPTTDIEPLIDRTITEILAKQPLIKLIDFIVESKIDWKAKSKRIMEPPAEI